jgi:hypothetical protein
VQCLGLDTQYLKKNLGGPLKRRFTIPLYEHTTPKHEGLLSWGQLKRSNYFFLQKEKADYLRQP